MAKVNAKVGQNICYVNENGNEIPGQVSAALKEGRINLVCWPHGHELTLSKVNVPHYNQPGARNGAHWKKV